MFLAFSIADIVQVPFGYIMELLYQLTNNYGVALILFSVIVQLVLLPATAKGKRSMMKMSRLSPLMQDIQRRYSDDQQKQNAAIQQLYKDEGVSMGGGCLWSFVPLLILLPLYTVVRNPITYMLHETAEVSEQIVEIVKAVKPEVFGSNTYYHQMIAARYIPECVEAIKAALPQVAERTLMGVNFDFIGIDLGAVPTFNIFGAAWGWDWAHIGAFLIALLSAGNQVLSMFISQKQNESVITDKDGIQDKDTAKNSQSAQTTQMMMYTMPLMMLWIGFTVPCALSLYWTVGGIIRTFEDVLLTNKYRKIYDAEDAERLARRMEQDRLEAEKERIRAERRAANPDGITENTSKKRLQKQQREQEQAEKAAAQKEYAARKGIFVEETEKVAMSGIAERPYCKGRNYDPDRYASHGAEE